MSSILASDPGAAGYAAAVPAEEARRTLDTLKNSGLVIETITSTPEQLAAQGFQPLPREVFAHVSGMLQPISGLLASQAAQGAYAGAYAGAYRLLIPKELAGMPRMEVKKLVKEFGEGTESMIFQGPNGKIAGHGGVQKMESPDLQAWNIAHLAFAAASVVTNQYFLCRIDDKLASIQSGVSELMQFLERRERNKLRANLETVIGYCQQCNTLLTQSDNVKTAKLTDAGLIQRDALAALYSYKEEFEQSNEKTEVKLSRLSLYFHALLTYVLALSVKTTLTENLDSAAFRQDLLSVCALIYDYDRSCSHFSHQLAVQRACQYVNTHRSDKRKHIAALEKLDSLMGEADRLDAKHLRPLYGDLLERYGSCNQSTEMAVADGLLYIRPLADQSHIPAELKLKPYCEYEIVIRR